MKNPTREKFLRKIYTATHRDYKGMLEGERSILVYRNGTTLVMLKDLTDKEMLDRIPNDLRPALVEFLKG